MPRFCSRDRSNLSLGFATLATTTTPLTASLLRHGLRLPLLRRGAGMLRACLIGAALLVGGTSGLQNAVANGDTRTLSFKHMHRGESATFTFKKNGRYDSAVLKQMNYYLRDWRNDKQIRMDPQLFDILWEVSQETGANAPIHVLSSYRSPETNSMLRRRSRGVAKQSQHTMGKALDFYIPGVAISDLRSAGLRLQRGGVGFYPTSGSPFVHMDTGSVRHWPRMTRSQLARVFPDGKTIHVPSDGKPMSGYDVALAEAQGRGSSGASDSGGKKKNFFAALFGGGQDEEEDSAPQPQPQQRAAPERPVAVASATRIEREPEMTAIRPTTVTAASAPLPTSRPSVRQEPEAPLPFQVARAPEPEEAERTSRVASVAPLPMRRPAELVASTPAVNMTVTSLERAPLPTVITRGTEREETGLETSALGYAADGEVFGPAPTARSATAGLATPARRAAETRRNRREQALAPKIAFDQLFLSPRLANTLYLRTPELRVFTSFVSAPREVVVSSFAQDPGFGLSSGFTGEAVASLDTRTFAAPAPAVAMSGRM